MQFILSSVINYIPIFTTIAGYTTAKVFNDWYCIDRTWGVTWISTGGRLARDSNKEKWNDLRALIAVVFSYMSGVYLRDNILNIFF